MFGFRYTVCEIIFWTDVLDILIPKSYMRKIHNHILKGSPPPLHLLFPPILLAGQGTYTKTRLYETRLCDHFLLILRHFFVLPFVPVLLFYYVVLSSEHVVMVDRCSVCLAEYEPDERLQKIPPCGHTFHINCIDHWLSTNTTCPLCRVSLLPAPKATSTGLDLEAQTAVEEESPNAHHRQEEGLVDANTPQEGEAAGGDGASSVQVEEPHGDAAEPLAVTVVAVAAPQADAEGSPSTACQTVKGKK
jgi:hypothetical protein